jgi:hypothetical protein
MLRHAPELECSAEDKASLMALAPESGVKIAFLDLDRFQPVNVAQDVISQIL